MSITTGSLNKWIEAAIRDDHNFQTKDVDPEVQKVKSMVREIIRKLKGRID